MKRTIVGLKWARRLEGKPTCIPTGRARGVKAFGIRYEKALAKWVKIPIDCRGVWFEFEDQNGKGYCQVDFLISIAIAPSLSYIPVVLELKHTWTEEGHIELEKLYLPVVSMALRAPAIGVVVVKKLTVGMGKVRICESLEEVLVGWNGAKRSVWHWIGGVAAKPQSRRTGIGGANGAKPPLAPTQGPLPPIPF